MDISFLNEFIDVVILMSLVGVVEMIKRADKKSDKRNVFYLILFAVLSLAASFFITMQSGDFSSGIIIAIGSALVRFLKYAGLGTVFYKLIAKYISTKNGGSDE
jgi:uncharacterized membrane protein